MKKAIWVYFTFFIEIGLSVKGQNSDEKFCGFDKAINNFSFRKYSSPLPQNSNLIEYWEEVRRIFHQTNMPYDLFLLGSDYIGSSTLFPSKSAKGRQRNVVAINEGYVNSIVNRITPSFEKVTDQPAY